MLDEVEALLALDAVLLLLDEYATDDRLLVDEELSLLQLRELVEVVDVLDEELSATEEVLESELDCEELDEELELSATLEELELSATLELLVLEELELTMRLDDELLADDPLLWLSTSELELVCGLELELELLSELVDDVLLLECDEDDELTATLELLVEALLSLLDDLDDGLDDDSLLHDWLECDELEAEEALLSDAEELDDDSSSTAYRYMPYGDCNIGLAMTTIVAQSDASPCFP